MPIDSTRDTGAVDPDDLTFAGKGAVAKSRPADAAASTEKVASDKAIDDLDEASKGAGRGPSEARFDDLDVNKDPGAKPFGDDDLGADDGPDKDDIDNDLLDVDGADDDGTDIDKHGLDVDL